MQIIFEKNPKIKKDPKNEINEHYVFMPNENWKLLSQNRKWNPPTDVFETENQVIIRIEIAGLTENDFEIIFDQNLLSISGTRIDTFPPPKIFHQMEVIFGDFLIEIEINIPVNLENSYAKYDNGNLIIHIDKAKPKTIKIGK